MADIIEILNDKGIKYETTNDPTEILIQCTSGQHEDTNPSLGYNLDSNVFKCFSCGFKGGVQKFLQSIGITEKINIESKQEYRILKLKKKLLKAKNIDNIKIPKATNLVKWDFGHLHKETLMEFNAFTTSEYELDNYICFPIYQFGRLKFIEARRRINNPKIRKYLRKPSHVTVSDVCFPVDKIDKTNHIILVEGLTDVLNMWQLGYRNTLCIFGANNFNKQKIDLLEKIGVTKVTLLMDGDAPGQAAAEKIQQLLEYQDILTNRVYLKTGEDPGNLTIDQARYYLNRT